MPGRVLTEAEVLTILERLGGMQWSLITTAQAQNAGIDRLWMSRLAGKGVTHRVRHGVYALPSSTYGPLQDLQAAWLATDKTRTLDERVMGDIQVAVSHTSAAIVHDLGDLVDSRHEFTSIDRRQSAQQDVHFYRRDLPSEDVVLKNGLPVTSVPRTLSDLAALGIDFDHLAQAVRDALMRGETDHQEISARFEVHAPTHGFAEGALLVDALLDEIGWPEAAETLMARKWGSAMVEAMRPHIGQGLISPAGLQMMATIQEALKSAHPEFTVELVIEQVAKTLRASDHVNMELLSSPSRRSSRLDQYKNVEAAKDDVTPLSDERDSQQGEDQHQDVGNS